MLHSPSELWVLSFSRLDHSGDKQEVCTFLANQLRKRERELQSSSCFLNSGLTILNSGLTAFCTFRGP